MQPPPTPARDSMAKGVPDASRIERSTSLHGSIVRRAADRASAERFAGLGDCGFDAHRRRAAEMAAALERSLERERRVHVLADSGREALQLRELEVRQLAAPRLGE